MNKIGFKNFRRFQNFEPLEYSGITFLVGRNNAGKSTTVKALLLIYNYFKMGDVSKFPFGGQLLEDVNIVTYGRAKNRKDAESNEIVFTHKVDSYTIEIKISGDDDKSFGIVHSLAISDADSQIIFHFEPVNRTLTITRLRSIKENELSEKKNIKALDKEIKEFEDKISDGLLKKTSREFISLLENLEKLKRNRLILTEELKGPKEGHLYSYTGHIIDNEIGLKEIVDSTLTFAIIEYNFGFKKIADGMSASDNFSSLRSIKEDEKIIKDSFNLFVDLILKYTGICYLGSSSIKQSALFLIRDKNNALSQSIHDYFQLKIQPGDFVYEFIIKWMKEFEVGDSFKIIIHSGEAYEVLVKSNEVDIQLADKGMGSIQAMLLIFRLAVIIHNSKTNGVSYTAFIEEPELNLHPALQSKLADLFLEINQKFGLDFLIETHSEYILRRSQVLVASNEFEVGPNENPFCVHYFPKDLQQMPYNLEYQEDGSFNRNFGEGFFDEASSSTLGLIKLRRQNKF